MSIETLIEVANCIIELTIYLFLLGSTLTKRDCSKVIRWIVLSGVLVVHTARTFMFLSTYWNMFITILLWSLILILLYKNHWAKKALIFLIYIVVMYAADIISRLIGTFIFDFSYDAEATLGIQRYINMAIVSFVMFTIFYYVSKIFKTNNKILTAKYWILILLMPLFSLFIITGVDIFIVQAPKTEITHIIFLFITLIGLLYLNIIISDLVELYSIKVELAKTNELLYQYEKQYKASVQNENELKTLNHDISNHVAVVREMAMKSSLKEMQDFANDLEERYSSISSKKYTSDLILDSILNMEKKKAEENGITISVNLNKMQEPINLTPLEKSILLCNALNNSIEACLKAEDKFISLNIESGKEKVRIEIINSSTEVEILNNTIRTTKTDKQNHGFGIQNMREVLRKHNGTLRITYERKMITLEMVFNNI